MEEELYKCLDLRDLPNEVWKDVVGYEGRYQVSNMGRVKSLTRKVRAGFGSQSTVNERVLKQKISKYGYMSIALNKDCRRRTYSVHSLVCIAFYGNKRPMQINHISCNKKDNRLSNLEWCDMSHNIRHAYDNGLMNGRKGTKHHMAKISEEEVLKIREDLARGMRNIDVARKFNIKPQRVYDIKVRRSWSHV